MCPPVDLKPAYEIYLRHLAEQAKQQNLAKLRRECGHVWDVGLFNTFCKLCHQSVEHAALECPVRKASAVLEEKPKVEDYSPWEPGCSAFWLDPELWDRTPYSKKTGRLEPCWMHLPEHRLPEPQEKKPEPVPEPKRDMVIAMVDGELREIERSEYR